MVVQPKHDMAKRWTKRAQLHRERALIGSIRRRLPVGDVYFELLKAAKPRQAPMETIALGHNYRQRCRSYEWDETSYRTDGKRNEAQMFDLRAVVRNEVHDPVRHRNRHADDAERA
jgi:hypothetical protein